MGKSARAILLARDKGCGLQPNPYFYALVPFGFEPPILSPRCNRAGEGRQSRQLPDIACAFCFGAKDRLAPFSSVLDTQGWHHNKSFVIQGFICDKFGPGQICPI
jgi:hypothetical protein